MEDSKKPLFKNEGAYHLQDPAPQILGKKKPKCGKLNSQYALKIYLRSEFVWNKKQPILYRNADTIDDQTKAVEDLKRRVLPKWQGKYWKAELIENPNEKVVETWEPPQGSLSAYVIWKDKKKKPDSLRSVDLDFAIHGGLIGLDVALYNFRRMLSAAPFQFNIQFANIYSQPDNRLVGRFDHQVRFTALDKSFLGKVLKGNYQPYEMGIFI